MHNISFYYKDEEKLMKTLPTSSNSEAQATLLAENILANLEFRRLGNGFSRWL